MQNLQSIFDPILRRIATHAFAIIVFAFSCAVVLGSSSASAQPVDAQDVQVPNFWDPRGIGNQLAVRPDTIRFLASDDFPPFVFRDGTGRLTGFNIDLARALCKELDAACSLRIKSFDALLPALESDEGDAVIAGLARTAETIERYRFSDPYLRLPARFVTLKENAGPITPEAMTSRRISVVKDTVHEAFLERYFPAAELIRFDTATESRAALGTDEADAHFGDALSLSFWLNGDLSGDCCAFAGGPWLEPGYFDRGLRIAFRSDDALRQDALNYALSQLQVKGIYSELYLRYFPVSFY